MSTINASSFPQEPVEPVRRTPVRREIARAVAQAYPNRDQVNTDPAANPYEGFAPTATRVTVDRWRKGPNDSIEHILRNQGYSNQEIYRKDGKGDTLIQRVARANGLKDPNLIRPGQKGLIVPSKEAPKVEPQPAAKVEPQPAAKVEPQPAAKVEPQGDTPAPPARAEEPAPPKRTPFVWRERKTETAPTEASLEEQEAGEVGLLLQGVKDKKFTRDEFQALNAVANQYTELRTEYARDGFKPEQMRELAQVQQSYGQMYARFLADDKARVTFSGAQVDTPAARFRAQQNDEGGQIYDLFSSQQLDEAATRARLLAQRKSAGTFATQAQAQ